MLNIRAINKAEFLLAQDFYTSVGYNYDIQLSDKVIVAEVNTKIIGVARIAIENNYYILRGMQIAKSYQRKKIGNQILAELDKIINNHECYCLPYVWLEEFYAQIRFKKIAEESAPTFLQERLKQNRENGCDLTIMRRDALG